MFHYQSHGNRTLNNVCRRIRQGLHRTENRTNESRKEDETTMTDKERFLSNLTVVIDTREQKNEHIKNALDRLKVSYESRKLDVGDYSYCYMGQDFTKLYAVERKNSVNELWGNIGGQRQRFEKEIGTMHSLWGGATLILENCESRYALRSYALDDETMQRQGRKVHNIGSMCDSTLQAWGLPNRFNLHVEFARTQADTAGLLLGCFFYHYQNYHNMVKPLKKEL